jgi:hypothetical protein
MKLSPLTVVSPGTEPTVVQTWLANVTFSYPKPDGTNEEHFPLSPWNSSETNASKGYFMGLRYVILTGNVARDSETFKK